MKMHVNFHSWNVGDFFLLKLFHVIDNLSVRKHFIFVNNKTTLEVICNLSMGINFLFKEFS